MVFLTLVITLSAGELKSQILSDSINLNLIKTGVDKIYNFEFRNAEEVLSKLSQSAPGHPVNYLLNGLLIYWRNYPLLPSSSLSAMFENEMQKAINLSEKKISGKDEAEYLLINLCARCMLLLYYSDNDLTSEVFPLTVSTYPYLRKAFNFTSVYSDFNFFTGLYNYYREAYPEAYPIYKTFAFLFPKGSKTIGLRELGKASRGSIFLKADSFSFLSGIDVYFENNNKNAFGFCDSLCHLYPENIQYRTLYIKCLLLMKQWDKAEAIINFADANTVNSLFKLQIIIFKGIIEEKKYHNYELAFEYYSKGVHDILIFGVYSNDFSSYGYFGLSRISEIKGDKNGGKTYRRKALELTEFKKLNFDD